MAEYTNRVAPEPDTAYQYPRQGYIPRYYNNTITEQKAEISQVKLAWRDVRNHPPKSTDIPAKSRPMIVRCLHCNKEVTTEIEYQSGGLTWILCCLLAAAGGFLGCCVLPFFINRFKDVLHSCPKCKESLVVYYRL